MFPVFLVFQLLPGLCQSDVFATIGKNGIHFAYAGHTDVVPVGNESSWTHPPISGRIDGNKLYSTNGETNPLDGKYVEATQIKYDKYWVKQ